MHSHRHRFLMDNQLEDKPYNLPELSKISGYSLQDQDLRGGVSALAKATLRKRMEEIKTVEELRTIDPTSWESAMWYHIHTPTEDGRHSRAKAKSEITYKWYMNSPEDQAVMPSAPPSLKVKPSMRPRKIIKPDYTINQLRQQTNIYNTPAKFQRNFTEWKTDTTNERSFINHHLRKETEQNQIFAISRYAQSRQVRINGETGEATQIGDIKDFYDSKAFSDYTKTIPPSTDLKGSGKVSDNVSMPKAEFIEEHERLIKILQKGTKADRIAEAKDQSEELQKVVGKVGGASIHMGYLQKMADSAYPGKTLQNIGSYSLVYQTPTLKFYQDDKKIVVAIRGTINATDWQANSLAVIGRLKSSNRYKTDLKTLLEFQSKYPKKEYHYVGVAHSLGAAILDGFIRAGLLRMGMSYNGLAEPQELRGNPLHHRIYHKNDPLYLAFGRYMPNIEVRGGTGSFFDKFTHNLPFGLTNLFTMYDKHRLKTFQGGGIEDMGRNRFKNINIVADVTLDEMIADAYDAWVGKTYNKEKEYNVWRLLIEARKHSKGSKLRTAALKLAYPDWDKVEPPVKEKEDADLDGIVLEDISSDRYKGPQTDEELIAYEKINPLRVARAERIRLAQGELERKRKFAASQLIERIRRKQEEYKKKEALELKEALAREEKQRNLRALEMKQKAEEIVIYSNQYIELDNKYENKQNISRLDKSKIRHILNKLKELIEEFLRKFPDAPEELREYMTKVYHEYVAHAIHAIG